MNFVLMSRESETRSEWARIKEERRPSLGQIELNDYEKRRLPLGNQYTDRRHKPIMCWQIVKAAAMYYEVEDWTSKVDPVLTYMENVELMRSRGTYGVDAGTTVKRAPIRLLETRPK